MSDVQVMRPQRSVLTSVFTPNSVKPPRHRQRFAPTATSIIPTIKSDLTSQLIVLLGIWDESFVYGQNRLLPNVGGPFHSHFDSCPPAGQFRQPTNADHAAQSAREAQSPLWTNLRQWRTAIGSGAVKRLLAAVLNDLMTEFVNWSYAGIYREELHAHLDFWVEHLFARLTRNILCALDESTDVYVSEVEVKRWKDMATSRLGALRVDELFEIIVDWDATTPAIEDLRRFTTNPATRGYLTHDFANALQTRLLHPGASTVEILQLYISIIRSFCVLDPKGVLLDRVTRKLRRYLRERDDTVKVIVAGLLSDSVRQKDGTAAPGDPEVLTELAVELSTHTAHDSNTDDSEFDWNNMEWMPDPIDAAPDYIKSKNTDVIASLITLFDSKVIFVKELQNTLADRLLKNKPDFNQEISVLEHLKIRFGESALQGCEVMLRDVLDSRKVDNVVRKDRGMDTQAMDAAAERQEAGSLYIELHTKILSRLFWPSMPEQTFTVPDIVLKQQESYEMGFEALKQSRKLTWLNTIGQVEVELELEDRTYHDEVLPWQAAVIYAFQGEADETERTVADLATELNMSPTLVRSACIFWVSKRILAEASNAKDTYFVLETLPDGVDSIMNDDNGGRPDAAAVAAEAAAAQAAREAEEEERKSKMAMYHQFVVSMLTNQGQMPLPRIAMMLGIVVPGGFPFSNEELKEFLAGMVKDGVLDVGAGGAYKVASS
ncbi:anaphase-promoting complex component APC2 [Exophiala viscosa]|uniref:Anaphase-promoting complex subunit 2 n=1 Tax=Exophiala viscosa TaxID=2486360 RepID=A0AAN6IBS1_9EURO|nr:anaphase-promoting complex component APC2 [Exophiala viscosa]